MTRTPTAGDAVRTGDGKITRELVLATALATLSPPDGGRPPGSAAHGASDDGSGR